MGECAGVIPLPSEAKNFPGRRLTLKKTAFALLAIICFSCSLAAAQQKDDPTCKDHPLFTRMPTYWIHGCDVKEFNEHIFPVGKNKVETVEGRYTKLSYYPQASAASKPSDLQIQRNFENVVRQLGGKSLFTDKGRGCFLIVKDGKEIWVDLQAEFTGKYWLTIVEREAMKQDIQADAAFFADGLRANGHVAVEGIYFDTGKTELRPESEAALVEIAKLLMNDPALKLHVVGHTDSVGGFEANLTLSQGRAAAVVQALVGRHGVGASRLHAGGVGPLAPVASNDSEEGRAKNRRVEIVQQ